MHFVHTHGAMYVTSYNEHMDAIDAKIHMKHGRTTIMFKYVCNVWLHRVCTFIDKKFENHCQIRICLHSES